LRAGAYAATAAAPETPDRVGACRRPNTVFGLLGPKAAADEHEHQVGGLGIEGDVADLVDDQ
jgi:hypothetical protein